MLLQSLQRLILPAVLIAAALLLRDTVDALPADYRAVMDSLPYLALGVALLLCVYYNRSLLFTLTALLILVYFLVQQELQVSLIEFRAWFVYSAISVCIPFSVLLLMFLPERGLWNRYGLAVVMLLPLQIVIAVLIFHFVPMSELTGIMNRYFSIWLHPSYLMSFYATLGFIAVMFISLLQLLRRPNEAVVAMLTVLIMAWITLAGFYLEHISLVMFSAAGVWLIICLVQSAHAMAYRDDLTGLLGRRALNERLQGLGRNYVIAMMDVDHFKSFNDTHGHDVGDDVLKMVARHINAVKGGGTAYRYGGEEFCVIFTGREIDACKPHLEAVRTQIAGYRMVLRDRKHRSKTTKSAEKRRGRRRNERGRTVSVTISIGVAAPDEKSNNPELVIRAADNALYKAKKQGRNCLVST